METIETLNTPDDVALADRMKVGRDKIIFELKKLIVGQDDIINQVLLTLFVGGNSLIIGVPGLAKTLLIHTISRVLDLKFSRIQFTPDLMPSDITGTDILQDDPETGRARIKVRIAEPRMAAFQGWAQREQVSVAVAGRGERTG